MILYIETIFYICLIQNGILFLSMKHALFPERKFLRFSQVFKQKSQGIPCDSCFISPFLEKVWPVF